MMAFFHGSTRVLLIYIHDNFISTLYLTIDNFKNFIFQIVKPVHGHRSDEPPLPFRPTREGEIQFIEDPEISLASEACNEYTPKQLGDTSIKGKRIEFSITKQF